MRRFTVPAIFLFLLISLSVSAFSAEVMTHNIIITFDEAGGTVFANPPNSVITSGQSIMVEDATYINVSATPAENYLFDGWFVNGNTSANSLALSENFYVTSDATIEAKFTFDGGGAGETIDNMINATGPSQVEIGEVQNYSSNASSSLGHGIEFQFEWGDESFSAWGSATQSHAWESAGTYNITVTARCVDHPEIFAVSPSSYPVTVIDPEAAPVDEFILTTLADPPEGGYVARSWVKDLYASGDQVLLTAHPNENYKFSHWIDGEGIYENSDHNVTITGNRYVTAVFEIDTTIYYQLNTMVNPPEVGDGTLIDRYPYKTEYTSGESVQLVARDAVGYVFKGWSLDATGTLYSSEYSINIIIDGNKTVYANYEAVGGEPGAQYELTFEVTPDHSAGVIHYFPERYPPLYDPNEVVQVSATPNPGFVFISWGADAFGTDAVTNVTMNNDKHVIANFATDPGDPGTQPGGNLPPATANMQYYFKLITDNIDDSYALVSGPPWLTLAPDGVFGGMPAAADVGNGFAVTVTVFETGGGSYDTAYFIDVLPEGGGIPTDEKLPPATANQNYYFMITGHPVGTTFTLIDSPQWMTLDTATGVFGGMPAAADIGNSIPIEVSASITGGTTVTLKFSIDVLSEGEPGGEPGDEPLPPAKVGEPYQFQLVTRNPDDTYELVGGPAWITVSASGMVGGTPLSNDVGNSFSVSIKVIETGGIRYDMIKMIDVFPGEGQPGEGSLPPATAFIPYSFQLPVETTGLTFAIVSAPGWISIDQSGMLSGTPASFDVGYGFSVVVKITDIAGSVNKEFFIDVNPGNDPGDPGGEPEEYALPSAVVNSDYYFMLPHQNPGETFDIVRAPGWMTLDRISGVFGGMPAAADEGYGINVIINIKNSTGDIKEIRLMIDVFPDDSSGGPGEIILPPAIANMEYYFMIPKQNPEDTFELVDSPGWMRLNGANGQLSGMPTAAGVGDMIPVKIIIRDVAGGTVELVLSINVLLEGDPGVPGEKFLPPAIANMEYYFMLPNRNPGDSFEIEHGPDWLTIDSAIGQFGGMPADIDIAFGIEVTILVTSLTGNSYKDLYMMDVLSQDEQGYEPGEKFLPPAIANMDYIFYIPFGGPEDSYELTEGPGWMWLDDELGELRGIPAAADVMNGIPVTIRITDSTGGSRDEMFMMDVYPEGVDDNGMELPAAVVNEPYYFMFPGRSADDTFELIEAPEWLMMDRNTGQMTGMPLDTDIAEDIPIEIMISGPDGNSIKAKLKLNVYPEGSHGGDGLPFATVNMEYSFLLPDDNADAKYELITGPGWLSLDPDIGEFTGMPSEADIGEGIRVDFTITLRTGAVYEKTTKIDVYPEGGPGAGMFLPSAIVGIEYDFKLPRENIDDIFEIIDGPDWLTIDSRTGQFSGIPADEDIGMDYTVTIRVNGDSAKPYDMKFMVEVMPFGQNEDNHLPPAIANMEYYFMIPRLDIDGEIELISGPAWLNFDSVNRVFSGMPAAADIGMEYSVIVKITVDGIGDFEETLIIEVYDENGPQDNMFLPAAIANMPYYFKIPDLMPDDILEIIDGPEWLELDKTRGQLSGVPAETDVGYGIPVTFQITDSESQVFQEVHMIDVLQEGGAKGLFLPPATVNLPYEYFLPKRNADDKIALFDSPGWLVLEPTNALLKGIPSKDDVGFGIPVTITITETSGESYTETLLLEVFHAGGHEGDFLPPATVNMQYYYLPPEANPGDKHEIITGPAWLMMDSRTAQLTGMPAVADAGYGIPVVIKITPVEGEFTEINLMIDVFPEGGDNGGIILPAAIANIPYDHVFPKRNVDDTIEVLNGPDWLTINSKSGLMHGIPTDDDIAYGISVNIKITDSAGVSIEETYMLDVFPAGDFGGKYLPPAAVNIRYNFIVPMNNPDDIFTIGEAPEWMTANPETGSLTGTPAAADAGYGIPVTLLITGIQEIVRKETYMLDVIPEGGAANVAGMFLPSATATVPYNFTLPKKNPDDTFVINEGPAWLLVDEKTGVLSGTPAETDVGFGIPVTLGMRKRTGEINNETLILDVFSATGPKDQYLPPAEVSVEYEFKIPKKNPDDMFEILEGPAWLSIYPKSGLLTGIPDSTDTGFGIRIKLSVYNRLGETYEEKFLINVLTAGSVELDNFAPSFKATTLKDAYENSLYLEVLYVSDDNLGEKLSYAKISGPEWLDVDAVNGQLSGKPQNGDVGSNILLSVLAMDAAGYADTLTTSINVIDVENPPEFITRKIWDATNDVAYSDTVEVRDADDETQFTFAIITGPDWLSINNSGILSGTPGTGDVGLKKPLSIMATDSTGLSKTLETTINVLSETQIESVVIAQTDKVVKIGGTVQYSANVMTNFDTVAQSAPVHWNVVGNVGTIDDDGLFTAEKGGVGIIEASTTVVDRLITSQVPVTVFLEKYKLPRINTDAPISIDDVTYPLDFVKGAKLLFTKKSLPEDISIDMKLPTFAHIDNDNKRITYENNILSAITFDVLVDGEAAGTYYFNEPIKITLPYDANMLQSLGLSPSDLRIFYVTDSGKLVGDEIFNIVVDSQTGTISADVSHFSTFAFVSKYDGPALIGDYDYDMDIDFFDFVQLVTYWNAGNIKGDLVGKASGTNKAGPAPWWNNSYLYPEDGVIDFEDLSVFALMHNWYQSKDSDFLAKPPAAAKKSKTDKTTGLTWDEKHYSIGDTLTVSLNAGYIDDFIAAEIVLNYDNTLLKVTDVKSSYAGGFDTIMTPVQFKTSNGSLTASAVTLGNLREGFSIYGQNLFEIKFEVIRNGELNIELAEIDMRNFLNNSPIFKIENTFINGIVGEGNVPQVFELSQNYPNPFNMTTTINYSIDVAGRTDISVYNTLGQKVKTLINENLDAGRYKLVWNGTDESGIEVSSGVYIITLRNNKRFDTKQILMLK